MIRDNRNTTLCPGCRRPVYNPPTTTTSMIIYCQNCFNARIWRLRKQQEAKEKQKQKHE